MKFGVCGGMLLSQTPNFTSSPTPFGWEIPGRAGVEVSTTVSAELFVHLLSDVYSIFTLKHAVQFREVSRPLAAILYLGDCIFQELEKYVQGWAGGNIQALVFL